MAARDPSVGRKAQPDQHVAAKRLDNGDAFARITRARGIDAHTGRRAAPRASRATTRMLVSISCDAHPHARIDVARGEHRHFEVALAIRRIGEIAARVEVAPRGAADMAAGRPARRPARATRCRWCRCGPAATACRRRSGRSRRSAARSRRAAPASARAPSAAMSCRDAAGHDCVHHQPMAEHLVARGEHALAEDAAMGVDERKRCVVADRADVAEMVGDALELGHDAADYLRARRRFDARAPPRPRARTRS